MLKQAAVAPKTRQQSKKAAKADKPPVETTPDKPTETSKVAATSDEEHPNKPEATESSKS